VQLKVEREIREEKQAVWAWPQQFSCRSFGGSVKLYGRFAAVVAGGVPQVFE
jgi:hypothetical protein